MLRLDNVSRRFGGLAALNGVSLQIRKGELVGLIGPNGAGKTTLFNVASGFIAPTTGRVWFEGRDVTGFQPHVLAELGLVRTFQGARVFPKLTIRESLRIARHLPEGGRAASTAPALADVMAEFGLERYADELAGSLPSGTMRELGIAMALCTGARMLLLDEPAAGLSAEEAANLQRVIRRVHAMGTTVLVIEHNLHFLMGLVERAYVLDAGALIAQGTPAEITRDPLVVRAYLGAEGPGAQPAEDESHVAG